MNQKNLERKNRMDPMMISAKKEKGELLIIFNVNSRNNESK